MVKKKYPQIAKMKPTDCLASKAILSMRSLSNIYKKYLRPHNITQSQLGILMVIAHCGKIPQAELGRIMMLDRSTVTRDLKRLIERGLVEREGTVNRLNIEMTEQGLNHLENILPDWEKALGESKKILGEDGMAALELVLAKLTT